MNRLVATPVKAWGRFAKSASPPTCVGSYGSWSRWALAGSEADHERLKQRPNLVCAPFAKGNPIEAHCLTAFPRRQKELTLRVSYRDNNNALS